MFNFMIIRNMLLLLVLFILIFGIRKVKKSSIKIVLSVISGYIVTVFMLEVYLIIRGWNINYILYSDLQTGIKIEFAWIKNGLYIMFLMLVNIKCIFDLTKLSTKGKNRA